jgi:HlyD family secretion protein
VLDTATANQQLERVSTDASAVKTTEDDMNLAYSRLQRAQTAMDDCIKISCGERVRVEAELNEATKAYQRASDAFQTARLRFETNVNTQAVEVEDAQEELDQAIRNLNAAQAGPNANKLAIAQAKAAVAEANLNDAQQKLDELLNGADSQDVEAAQARVMAAQATVDAVQVVAPFDGEVVQVNYQPGDAVQQTLEAVVLANRSRLHVDVSVDESDVSTIALGDPVTVTLDSLPELTLTGQVVQINPLGSTTQGLVRYTVRVDLVEADPRVLLGMTANVTIVTNTDEGALAVPLDAVQLDQQGEYVNRVDAAGAIERVNITSGEVQDDMVVVSGPLSPGDRVQLVEPVPVNSGAPFGPG